jgi:general secretion pathway protein K
VTGSARGSGRPWPGGDRSGFALVLALFALAAVGLAAAEVHAAARLDRRLAVNARDATRARWAARAGLARALDQLHRSVALAPARADLLASSGDTLLAPLVLDADGVRVETAVVDARARLNLNRAESEDVARLAAALGLPDATAARVGDAVLDWRDADDLHRARGAEREAYEALWPPRAPKNGPFDRPEEIAQVLGVGPELAARLVALGTIAGDGRVNVNSAPAPVLRTIPGVDAAAAAAIVSHRRRAPYRNVFELAPTLPEPARTAFRTDLGRVLTRVAFSPRAVEVHVRAQPAGSRLQRHLYAVVVLTGGAAVRIQQVDER